MVETSFMLEEFSICLCLRRSQIHPIHLSRRSNYRHICMRNFNQSQPFISFLYTVMGLFAMLICVFVIEDLGMIEDINSCQPQWMTVFF